MPTRPEADLGQRQIKAGDGTLAEEDRGLGHITADLQTLGFHESIRDAFHKCTRRVYLYLSILFVITYISG